MIIDREEKKWREREQRMIPNATASQVAKKSGVAATVKLRRAELLVSSKKDHGHSSLLKPYFRKNEIIIFME